MEKMRLFLFGQNWCLRVHLPIAHIWEITVVLDEISAYIFDDKTFTTEHK